MTEAYTLAHVRAEKLHISCEQCQRHGSYTVSKLMEKYGTHTVLPEVKDRIIREAGCPHVGNMWDICKAKFTKESVLSWTRPEDLEQVARVLK